MSSTVCVVQSQFLNMYKADSVSCISTAFRLRHAPRWTNSLAHIDEKNRAIKQLEGKLRSSVAEQEERNASNTLELQSASRRSDCEGMRRPDRRRDRALISSVNGDGRAGIMAGTSGLRSSLAGIKTQVSGSQWAYSVSIICRQPLLHWGQVQ